MFLKLSFAPVVLGRPVSHPKSPLKSTKFWLLLSDMHAEMDQKQ